MVDSELLYTRINDYPSCLPGRYLGSPNDISLCLMIPARCFACSQLREATLPRSVLGNTSASYHISRLTYSRPDVS
ncbi:hypothetical protein AG1IA_09301 [Rhizoctonia solani AG-1 IA]|uniref:Uncharacterized protein n=1 Tax=Thanatephorus cucumeris (strain AG1-IA) TaxID=983506 RepID=L8WJX9_THACA|nr:hypothetical protein AG1IA_09301 [Rhizoctonia solani AG-1 IA]